jgi:hypothetical protein
MSAATGIQRTPEAASGGGRSAELGSFVAVGLACTAAYALLYSLLRSQMTDLTANAVALLLTMGANFEANRRFTFKASTGSRRRQVAGYAAAYAVGLAASSIALRRAREHRCRPDSRARRDGRPLRPHAQVGVSRGSAPAGLSLRRRRPGRAGATTSCETVPR